MTWPAFTSESRLLLECGRPGATSDPTALRRALAGGFSWPSVLQLAGGHGMRPLLYRAIRDAAAEVPPAVRESLRSYFQQNAARNLFLAGQLERVAAALEAEGIRGLWLKGPVLSVLAYNDLALRESWDLDMLIAPTDLERTIAALVTCGFRQKEEAPFRAGSIEVAFSGPCLLDLHWQLTPGYFPRIDPAALWDRTIRTRVLDKDVPTLSNEHLLLYLAIHSARDCWAMLRSICDTAHLISRAAIDWSYLLAEAERTGASRMLEVNLLLAAGLLGAPVHGSVPRPKKRTVKTAERVAEAMLSQPPAAASVFREAVTHLRLLEKPKKRLQYLLQRAFVPTQMDSSAQANSSVVRHLVRPARLILKFAAALRFTTANSSPVSRIRPTEHAD